MWTLLKSLLTKWALFKVLLRTLGSLAWLIPIALILKAIGLPMLITLAILAYGLWWSFDRVVHFRTWIGAPVMAWRRPRILSRLGAELMDQRFRLR